MSSENNAKGLTPCISPYNNGSEVVREALRLMIQRDADREGLRASVAEGFQQIQDGKFTEVSSPAELLALARARRVLS